MAEQERPIVIYGALAANLGIAVAKFIAAALTGSSAMISEGIHSLVDTGNQLLLLFGIHRGRAPADHEHPYGHGRALYFWSLVVAILLFGIGGGMSIYEGVTHIVSPTPIGDPTISIVVLAIAALLEGSSWTIAARDLLPAVRREGIIGALRTSKDPSTLTVLAEDSAALTGLAIAFAGIVGASALDEPRLDGLASIGIGTLLATVAVFLAVETRSLLIGETADDTSLEAIGAALEWPDRVARVDRLRTMHLGPEEILVTARVVLRDDDRQGVADSVAGLHRRIREAEPRATDITIEPVAAGRPDAAEPSRRSA